MGAIAVLALKQEQCAGRVPNTPARPCWGALTHTRPSLSSRESGNRLLGSQPSFPLQMVEWLTGPHVRRSTLSSCVLMEESGCLADTAGDKVWQGAGQPKWRRAGRPLSLLCSVTSHQARAVGLCPLPSLVLPPDPLSLQTQATCPAGCSPCTRCHQAFPLKTPLPGTSLPVLASERPLVHPAGHWGPEGSHQGPEGSHWRPEGSHWGPEGSHQPPAVFYSAGPLLGAPWTAELLQL